MPLVAPFARQGGAVLFRLRIPFSGRKPSFRIIRLCAS
jgi:hypothetical protein